MTDQDRRIALVIGNAAYAHASTLANPLNDARDISEALARIGFSGVPDQGQRVPVLTLPKPSVLPFVDLDYNKLRRVLAAFARAAENAEQAVLYYAGHGIEVAGQNYLIPVDARLEHIRDVEFETASLMQVLGAVEGARGLRLVILDACRDNPFRSRLFSTRDASRGLRAIEPSSNTLVAYAAKHGTVAMDGTDGNSPYASALLQHLDKPGLEIVDLFREVKDAVLEATGNRQEPYLYGSLGRRREYFVKPAVSPTTVRNDPPQVDERTFEHTYWLELKDSQDPSDFEEFLVRFPTSQYIPLARRNSERLIKQCHDTEVLDRFASAYPASPRSSLANQRVMELKSSVDTVISDTRSPVSLLQLILSPFWRLVGFLGFCSALLCGITFTSKTVSFSFLRGINKSESAPLHAGIIFSVAICFMLYLIGMRNAPKLFLIALVANLAWPAAFDLARIISLFPSSSWPLMIAGGTAGGLLGSAAVSSITQWTLGKIDSRTLIYTSLIGGMCGATLALDVFLVSYTESESPWICFMVWQPVNFLMIASITWRWLQPRERAGYAN